MTLLAQDGPAFPSGIEAHPARIPLKKVAEATFLTRCERPPSCRRAAALCLPECEGRVQQQEAHSTQEALIWGGMLWVIAPL